MSDRPYLTRPTGIPGLQILDPIALQDRPVPERRWLVDSLIPHGNVTMLAGDGGVGKSLVAMQLLAACALKKQWLGRNTMPCKALGIFCEDDNDELHRRLIPIVEHYDAGLCDLVDLQLCSRVGMDNALMTFDKPWEPGEVTQLSVQIMNQAIETGAQIVVIDSLHDVFAGDENKRSQARQFIQELRTIAVEIDGAVLLTAHPSLSGRNSGSGEAGSTAWSNAVRSRLYLARPDVKGVDDLNQDARTLHDKKSNYARGGTRVSLTWHRGVFVVDLDTVEVAAHITGKAAIALKMLKMAIDEAGEIPPDNHRTPKNVRAVRAPLWKAYCRQGSIADSDKPDTQDKAFRRASQTLQEREIIGVWGEWVWVART